MKDEDTVKTRPGRYQVTFSLPSPIYNNFVAFSVEDIEHLAHARQIERSLMDGGAESVYVSQATRNEDQPFVSAGPCTLPPGAVGYACTAMKDSWSRSR